MIFSRNSSSATEWGNSVMSTNAGSFCSYTANNDSFWIISTAWDYSVMSPNAEVSVILLLAILQNDAVSVKPVLVEVILYYLKYWQFIILVCLCWLYLLHFLHSSLNWYAFRIEGGMDSVLLSSSIVLLVECLDKVRFILCQYFQLYSLCLYGWLAGNRARLGETQVFLMFFRP